MARDLVSLMVACDEGAPSGVRAALLRHQGELGRGIDDVVLVASELAAHVVQRPRSDPITALPVDAILDARCLLISVIGPSIAGQPEPVELRANDESDELRFAVFEQLREHWGIEQADGYRVWAKLTVPG